MNCPRCVLCGRRCGCYVVGDWGPVCDRCLSDDASVGDDSEDEDMDSKQGNAIATDERTRRRQ